MQTKETIRKDLLALGLGDKDLVMVHASLRAVGDILGGAQALVAAILDIVGKNGAMMMYIGAETPFDDVGRKTPDGRPRLGDQEKFILENCPVFDPVNASACRDHGALAEVFRAYRGTLCSHQVSWRMAANGARAAWLVADHPMQYGADAGSPMDKLTRAREGKVLVLGADLDHVSLLHYAEGRTSIEPKRKVHIKVPLEKRVSHAMTPQRVWIDVTEHDSSIGIVEWPDRYFETVMRDYFTARDVKAGQVGQALSYLVNAQDLVNYAVPHMEKTAQRGLGLGVV